MSELRHRVYRAHCAVHGFWHVQTTEPVTEAPPCENCGRELRLDYEGRALKPMPWTWVHDHLRLRGFNNRSTMEEIKELQGTGQP